MARETAFEDRVRTALEEHGIAVSGAEEAGLLQLAAWMHDGVQRLDVAGQPEARLGY